MDGLDDLADFGEKLAAATIRTVESGRMTGDLAAITSLEHVEKLSTLGFISAVREELEKMI